MDRLLDVLKAIFTRLTRRLETRNPLPPMPGTGSAVRLINILAIAFLVFAAIVIVIDPVVSGAARMVDEDVEHTIMDFSIAGKGNWILFPAAIACILGHAAAVLMPVYRLRVVTMHLATLAGYIFWAVAAPGILVAILKQLVGRPRPFYGFEHGYWDFSPWSGYDFASFPSGDTCNAFALAMALGLMFPRLRPAFFVYAIFVGSGRIIGNLHFVSDVMAGAAIGAAGAYVMARVFLYGRNVFDVNSKGCIVLRGRKAVTLLWRWLTRRRKNWPVVSVRV